MAPCHNPGVTPQGWYADPTAPASLRWWNGTAWTEHVSARPLPAAPAVPVTPDGALLAGWWERAVAQLVDGLLIALLSAAFGYPFVAALVHVFADFFRDAVDAAQVGAQPPSQLDLYGAMFLPLLGFGLVSALVNAVYVMGFLKARAATPGKLMMGLRVRLRDRPGPLEWRTVGRRWLGQYWYAALSWVPLLGSVVGLYAFIDCLWPLRDDTRQALHDKFAATNVVRRPRP
ncbi:MAG: domain containing protein [Nocardioidaceae bacterium]|nr:domain containing protein [Nocardioidaceae bacterium]